MDDVEAAHCDLLEWQNRVFTVASLGSFEKVFYYMNNLNSCKYLYVMLVFYALQYINAVYEL